MKTAQCWPRATQPSESMASRASAAASRPPEPAALLLDEGAGPGAARLVHRGVHHPAALEADVLRVLPADLEDGVDPRVVAARAPSAWAAISFSTWTALRAVAGRHERADDLAAAAGDADAGHRRARRTAPARSPRPAPARRRPGSRRCGRRPPRRPRRVATSSATAFEPVEPMSRPSSTGARAGPARRRRGQPAHLPSAAASGGSCSSARVLRGAEERPPSGGSAPRRSAAMHRAAERVEEERLLAACRAAPSRGAASHARNRSRTRRERPTPPASTRSRGPLAFTSTARSRRWRRTGRPGCAPGPRPGWRGGSCRS